MQSLTTITIKNTNNSHNCGLFSNLAKLDCLCTCIHLMHFGFVSKDYIINEYQLNLQFSFYHS